jgi:PII-like signaling protein
MRTDRLLTLSEDLPVVSVAVDAATRIEGALSDVRALKHPGLITLERARLLTDHLDTLTLPEELHEATKLTAYVGRHERRGRAPLFVAVCDLLHRAGIAGATVLLGVDGTRAGRRARARFFASNAEVPVMIISIGPGRRIAGVLPELGELLGDPLVTLERVRICKRDGRLLAQPRTPPDGGADPPEPLTKLMIHASESARHDGHPLHRALVRRLRAAGVAGATTLRGIWGYHGEHPPHGDRLLQLHRHVPTVTVVIDRHDRIARAFEVVDEVTARRGLVTSEFVPRALGTHAPG